MQRGEERSLGIEYEATVGNTHTRNGLNLTRGRTLFFFFLIIPLKCQAVATPSHLHTHYLLLKRLESNLRCIIKLNFKYFIFNSFKDLSSVCSPPLWPPRPTHSNGISILSLDTVCVGDGGDVKETREKGLAVIQYSA